MLPLLHQTAHRFLLLVLVVFIILLTACAVPETVTEPASAASSVPGEGAAVSFSRDVLPILQSRCVRCHGGEKTEKQLNLTGYDNLMAGSEDGAVVIPGDADNSPLIQLVLQGKMPKRSPRLLPAQIQILVDWVTAGALNN